MSNANAPVFIGGLSGSGKTQLRMVVGAHPAISMTRRTYMWERYYRRFGDLRDPRHLDRCLSTMCVDPGVRQLAPDRARIEREFAGGPHRYALLFALFHRHHAERSGKQRWGDQLGFVERFADPIFESIPGACMVHMVRDPRERVVAGTRGVLLGKVGWETARWIRSAELARRNERRYGASYLVVHYEDLAARPLDVVQRVCEFIGEELDPAMTEALRKVRFDDRTWEDPSGFVDRHAGGAIAEMGYSPVTRCRPDGRGPSGVRDRALEVAAQPLNRAGMAAWQVLKDRPLAKRVGS